MVDRHSIAPAGRAGGAGSGAACGGGGRGRGRSGGPWPSTTPPAARRSGAHLGACPSNDAPTAAAPHRHLSTIISLTWCPPCARNDRGNLLDVGRPRYGDHYSDRPLGYYIVVAPRVCGDRQQFKSPADACARGIRAARDAARGGFGAAFAPL